MGFNILFPSVAATVVGGVGSFRGAALAGFMIGLLQNVLVWKLGNQWQEAMIFLVVIVFFLYRPEGLFGRPVARIRV
jgi:branched-subunit amino acid ABC-type transport system permease component